MPQIVLSAKKPFQVSASKEKLVFGKWMTSYLATEKEPFFKETLIRQTKELRNAAEKANRTRKEEGAGSTATLRADKEVYRQAMSYSETYWKHMREKMVADPKNAGKYKKSMRKAEEDFNHFSNKYEFLRILLSGQKEA
ncbi:MAG: hypothetical protein WC462_01255 [archaeon]